MYALPVFLLCLTTIVLGVHLALTQPFFGLLLASQGVVLIILIVWAWRMDPNDVGFRFFVPEDSTQTAVAMIVWGGAVVAVWIMIRGYKRAFITQ